MHHPPDLWLFFLLVFGVVVLPGLDMAYVASHALVGGLRAGATAVAGIMAGGLVHVAVAATGIAAVLTTWPAAFDGLLAVGAAYMLWVGWGLWRAAQRREAVDSSTRRGDEPLAPARLARVFQRAVLTCLANPKAYAFTLSVFPAFVRPGARPLLQQAWPLAAIVVGTQALVYGTVAVAVAGTGRVAGAGAAAQRWLPRMAGALLMGGALATLLLGWKPAQAQTSGAAEQAAASAARAPAAASARAAPAIAAATTADPSHDFDFLFGDWRVENRKRLHVLQGDDRWENFPAELHVRPLAGGVGNRDDYEAPSWRPGYTGVTLRLYDPRSRRWSLYWLSSRGDGLDPATGRLTDPVVGRFAGHVGVFEGDDSFEGRPIRVRYTWTRIDATHAAWAQAFSADAGAHWETNWTMAFTRIDPVAAVLAAERAVCEAYLRGDADAMQRELTDDFTLINGRGETSTKAQDMATARSGAIRYSRFENREMLVRLYGDDAAVVTGITAVAGATKDGHAFDIDVRFTDTFVREQGRWRIAASQASSPLKKE